LREEVEKYPSLVGFEAGTLAIIANTLTTFPEMTDDYKSEFRFLGPTEQKNPTHTYFSLKWVQSG